MTKLADGDPWAPAINRAITEIDTQAALSAAPVATRPEYLTWEPEPDADARDLHARRGSGDPAGQEELARTAACRAQDPVHAASPPAPAARPLGSPWPLPKLAPATEPEREVGA